MLHQKFESQWVLSWGSVGKGFRSHGSRLDQTDIDVVDSRLPKGPCRTTCGPSTFVSFRGRYTTLACLHDKNTSNCYWLLCSGWQFPIFLCNFPTPVHFLIFGVLLVPSGDTPRTCQNVTGSHVRNHHFKRDHVNKEVKIWVVITGVVIFDTPDTL